MKYKIIEALTSNQAKTLYWTILNGVIAMTLMVIADIDWKYAPIAIAVLNMVTKSINKKL